MERELDPWRDADTSSSCSTPGMAMGGGGAWYCQGGNRWLADALVHRVHSHARAPSAPVLRALNKQPPPSRSSTGRHACRHCRRHQHRDLRKVHHHRCCGPGLSGRRLTGDQLYLVLELLRGPAPFLVTLVTRRPQLMHAGRRVSLGRQGGVGGGARAGRSSVPPLDGSARHAGCAWPMALAVQGVIVVE